MELQKTDNNDGSNEDNNKLYSNQYHSRSSSFPQSIISLESISSSGSGSGSGPGSH